MGISRREKGDRICELLESLGFKHDDFQGKNITDPLGYYYGEYGVFEWDAYVTVHGFYTTYNTNQYFRTGEVGTEGREFNTIKKLKEFLMEDGFLNKQLCIWNIS